MYVFKRNLTAAVLYFVSVLFAGAAVADEEARSRVVQPSSQASAEGVNLQLVTSASGDVVAVRIQECESCQPTSLLPAPNMEIVLGDKVLNVDTALSLEGRGGTVLYNSQNRLAEVVIFYGQ